MTTTSLGNLLEQVQPADSGHAGVYRATLTAGWTQGRSAFGGVMAALASGALRRHIGDDRPLRALLTSFIGPAAPGELRIECNTLRQGKSVIWAEAKILQDEAVCAAFSACFGRHRESRIRVEPQARPSVRGPDGATVMPQVEGMTPAFMQQFDLRWATGQLPVSSSPTAAMGVWVRFLDPSSFGEAHVVALMDVLPPAVLQMFDEMRPISSLSWHLEFLDDLSAEDARDGDGWWFFDVAAHAAVDGYSQQHATLYTPTGRAIAMSQQAIAIFA